MHDHVGMIIQKIMHCHVRYTRYDRAKIRHDRATWLGMNMSDRSSMILPENGPILSRSCKIMIKDLDSGSCARSCVSMFCWVELDTDEES